MLDIPQSKRDLRHSADLTRDDVLEILQLASELKTKLKHGEPHLLLRDQSLAMIFEKPSLRTRCTFELGMRQLGGHALYLSPDEIGLGKRESIADIARNLERWFNFIMARTFTQNSINELAKWARIPVLNALSDFEHPCQALADFLTLKEQVDDLAGFNLTYIGDGNNVCHSLMLIGAKLGVNVTICSPKDYGPYAAVAAEAISIAKQNNAICRFEPNPIEAVKTAQAVYTDVWASMGQENEKLARAKIFEPFQVNSNLMANASKETFIMHDLPAHRGEEITDEVLDGPHSLIFEQAENRLHAQKAALVFLDRKCH